MPLAVKISMLPASTEVFFPFNFLDDSLIGLAGIELIQEMFEELVLGIFEFIKLFKGFLFDFVFFFGRITDY